MGLSDLDSGVDQDLTMFGDAGPCETKRRTLARGDMCGLYDLYNPAKLAGCLLD